MKLKRWLRSLFGNKSDDAIGGYRIQSSTDQGATWENVDPNEFKIGYPTKGDLVQKSMQGICLDSACKEQERLFIDDSFSIFKRNVSWPPARYVCGACDFHYSALEHHKCENQRDDSTRDFDTWCGQTFDPYAYDHTCSPYGKHARREGMSEDTYFVRVWSYGFAKPRHEFDWGKPSFAWIQDLSNPDKSGFGRLNYPEPSRLIPENEDWERLAHARYVC